MAHINLWYCQHFFCFTLHLVVFFPISVPNKLVANDDLVEGENGFYYITNEAAHVNYVCKINRENESLVPLGLPCCVALFAIVCC